MPTDRQLAANKKNAQKSTGPKTPEGRAAVRLNGVKHGLNAETLVLPGESQSDFDGLLASFEEEHQPETPTETALVRQMVMAQWRLLRLYHVEAAFLTLRVEDLDYDDPPSIEYQLADIIEGDCGRGSVRENLSRLEARLERSFYKALRELEHLRSTRAPKVVNQTQSTPSPEPKPGPFLVKTVHPVLDRPVPDPPTPIVNSPGDSKIGNM